ncbi:MAG TPA: hypothetical protein VLN49_07335 [Gemmatimonadaceae bacterium]|nr:hypothetical protein [Gemmatimonadaceae bacterium]
MQWGQSMLARAVAIAAIAMFAGSCVRNPSLLRGAASMVAPARAGVFVTPADFDVNQLASAIDCETETTPIARDAFRRGLVVEIPGMGQSPPARYSKTDVFGFRACDGSDVRFVEGESYRLERAAPLYLYERQRRFRLGNRGSRFVYDHFFSTAARDSLRPLTLLALKEAYFTNHRFHDLLDLAFRSNDELMRYDDLHHEYRVAWLLRETLPSPLRCDPRELDTPLP